ncbi:hypothetical protein [Alkalibacillus haloalkaliphilus]|uniref:Uncharacterized protein n=1 Tax=Alkalibacillus haloalkaliphilus TaxID=94136 RepID=A0A511W315_9BACI|nr:hypothetical protein [Alkalibacillus haloalkaliphilus]GEN45475.1 hypothetical protein AHA02nite_12510 [Alkalibacillus haloalkaliphilus]
MKFIEQVIISFISALLFTIIAPQLGIPFLTFFWVTFLIMFTLGRMLNYFVKYIIDYDRFRSSLYRYMASVMLYAYGGVLILASLSLVIDQLAPLELSNLLTLGVLPAWLYFHLDLLVKRLLPKLMERNDTN